MGKTLPALRFFSSNPPSSPFVQQIRAQAGIWAGCSSPPPGGRSRALPSPARLSTSTRSERITCTACQAPAA